MKKKGNSYEETSGNFWVFLWTKTPNWEINEAHLDYERLGVLWVGWVLLWCKHIVKQQGMMWYLVSLGPHFFPPLLPIQHWLFPPSGKYTVMWLSESEHLHSLARVIGPRTGWDSSQGNQSPLLRLILAELQEKQASCPTIQNPHPSHVCWSPSQRHRRSQFLRWQKWNNLTPSTISLSILKGLLNIPKCIFVLFHGKSQLKWRFETEVLRKYAIV